MLEGDGANQSVTSDAADGQRRQRQRRQDRRRDQHRRTGAGDDCRQPRARSRTASARGDHGDGRPDRDRPGRPVRRQGDPLQHQRRRRADRRRRQRQRRRAAERQRQARPCLLRGRQRRQRARPQQRRDQVRQHRADGHAHRSTRTPNADGWNNSDTTVHFAATDTDPGSGVDPRTTTPDVLVTRRDGAARHPRRGVRLRRQPRHRRSRGEPRQDAADDLGGADRGVRTPAAGTAARSRFTSPAATRSPASRSAPTT